MNSSTRTDDDNKLVDMKNISIALRVFQIECGKFYNR